MDSKEKGTLKTVYEDDEDNGSSEDPPTVEATPRGPYQIEIERLQQQLLIRTRAESQATGRATLTVRYTNQTYRNRPYSHPTGTPPSRHSLYGKATTTERTRRDNENGPTH